MNNDNEMRYLWTIAPDLTKEGIHILVEFIQIQQHTISSTQDINTTNIMEHVTAITQIVSHEPSMLYMTVTDDDAEIDYLDEDYVVSSQSFVATSFCSSPVLFTPHSRKFQQDLQEQKN
ncbi:hypothetical protein M9H77_34328 [Catharanthus roseus]|uniref:Uncharacterized protein n=1 Tax=Catharanthus roseus TaxID=4058 RepID=A0ACB9ZMR3_CATRO|nr:hypothetical protein M9H77_34328 [Catharanthus roseus]